MDFIIWVFVIGIFAGVGYLFFKLCKTSVKRIGEIEKDKTQFNAKELATLKHTSGLPLPKDVFIDVMYNDEKIVFKKDGTVISVSKDKIQSIDRTTGKSLHDQAAGAVIGKHIIGGTGGALLGAIIATKFYLIITYNSDGEDKYIILDEADSGFFGSRLEKDFARNAPQETRNIEL